MIYFGFVVVVFVVGVFIEGILFMIFGILFLLNVIVFGGGFYLNVFLLSNARYVFEFTSLVSGILALVWKYNNAIFVVLLKNIFFLLFFLV